MENVIRIKLKGLDCPHCAEKITADIKKLETLQNPQINLIKQELSVEKKQTVLQKHYFLKLLKLCINMSLMLRYLWSKIKNISSDIKGLDCAHCAAEIEQGTKTLPKVKNATVNLLKQQMEVTTEQYTSIEELLQKSISEIVHKHEPDVEVSIASQTQISNTKQLEKSAFQKSFKNNRAFLCRYCIFLREEYY